MIVIVTTSEADNRKVRYSSAKLDCNAEIANEMQITITLRFDADGFMRHPILFQTNKYRFYSNDKSDNCIPIDNSFIII